MTEKKTGADHYITELSHRFEKGAGDFMKAWKTQAKRPDGIGDINYRVLDMVHRGVGVAARSLTDLEKATLPPARTATTHHPHVVETPAKPAPTHTARRQTPADKPGAEAHAS